tara:strand:- start:93 stop:395 length:303 start_codon:yes stop_codon:yes gene_type:complete
MSVKIIDAILSINPNAEVSVGGEDLNNIQWHNGTTPISKANIQAKIDELQLKYDSEEWKRNRQSEYPSHDDCIHALLDGGNTLTELQEKRQAVKTKYPKP